MPTRNHADQPANILVMGLGGAGCNLVNRLALRPPVGVDLVLANTDAQALLSTKKGPKVLFLGEGSTRGLGAGSNHELGRLAAEQSASRLSELFDGVDMVFLTAGLGGGTGTGAAPIAAREARKAGALVVAVVTKPFEFEGRRRTRVAEEGVAALEEEVDTLLVLPNQKLLSLDASTGSLDDSFKLVDQVLCDAVRGMTEIVTVPGIINLDFADVKAVLASSGKAIFGMATAANATRAVEMALSNPLVGGSPDGAGGCLLNITAGPDLSLQDYSEASRLLQESASPDAMVLCGYVQDESMVGRARATVVATRVSSPMANEEPLATMPGLAMEAPKFRDSDIMPLAQAALPHSELTAFERRQAPKRSFESKEGPVLGPPPRMATASVNNYLTPKPTAKPTMPTAQRESSAERKNGWMNLPAIWRRSRRKDDAKGEVAEA